MVTTPGGEDTALSFEGHGVEGSNTPDIEIKESVKPPAIVNKNVPVSPEIPPQFPGGTNELIKFLKRNLNTPQQLEEGGEVAVRVRFIVNYNGELTGFDVIETGGKPFDNEVIRVLKKMPKWIPGKTSGENVSAHFIIPVIFRVSD
jgi:protein TonB